MSPSKRLLDDVSSDTASSLLFADALRAGIVILPVGIVVCVAGVAAIRVGEVHLRNADPIGSSSVGVSSMMLAGTRYTEGLF
jgi:hypothetical protein